MLLVALSGAGGGPKGGNQGNSPKPGQAPISRDEQAMDEFDPHWSPVGVFSNATVCASCHTASTDGSGVMRLPRTADGKDISPSAGWRHSMMAQAWNDPYFQATVEEQVSEFPGYAGDIEDKCLRCHSPMAHSYSHDTGLDLSFKDCSLANGCYRMDTSQQQDHAREGVSCTLCHQMVENKPESASGSGHFIVPAEQDAMAKTLYGPYQNPRTRPMQINTGYRVKHGSYLSSSEHCASCHDLSTPAFDINTGHPTDPAIEFKEQAPYAEWRNSLFSDGGADDRSCQDCHMQGPQDYKTPVAVMPSGRANGRWPERSPYSLHGVAGGNTYVLGLLKTWREELGISQSTTEQGFEEAINTGRDFLRKAADINLSCHSRDSTELRLCVTIDNRTGHKLPTGYPSRRMWVQLTVTTTEGAILFDSGRPDQRGYLDIDKQHTDASCLDTDKAENFDSSVCYERHRNHVTRESQVAIYQAVMADSNGAINYSLLYSAAYLKDNRIPPAGFSSRSETFDESTAITGYASMDRDFNRDGTTQGSGSDTVHYQIPVPARQTAALKVEARLWYQSISPAFGNSMSHGGDKAQLMQTMYRQQPPLPELLGMATLVVE